MSFNGSGTFNINSTGQPVVTGTTISSTVFNALTADLATGLSTTITKDGQTATTLRIPFIFGINSSLSTDSTNTTTGSIITAGGVGIAKAVFIGTTLNVTGVATLGNGAVLGTPASMTSTNITGTATGLTSGITNALKSATTTVDVSTATAPTAGQALVATSSTAATWQSLPTTKLIYGLTYANNGSDATNDIDIAAGGCVDSTGVDVITVAALTKQSDVNWVVGTNQGGLDTGAVGNSDYYIWAIKRVDTGVTDVLFSLSSTAPTMPTNYTLKRLIGWFKRTGGTIVAFTTYETEGGGIELAWNAPTLDINLSNTLTTTRRTDAIKVPLNFSVLAHIAVSVYDASTNFTGYICCPDLTDTAPANQGVQLSIFNTQSTTLSTNFKMDVRTSATGTIAARTNLATVDNYIVSTYGFRWARRN